MARRVAVGLCALVALLVATIDSSAGTAKPDTNRRMHLAAGAHGTHRIRLRAGEAITLTVQQFDAPLVLTATTQGALTLTLQSDAGRTARMHLTLVATAPMNWQLDIAARKNEREADYLLAIGAPHTTTIADHHRAAAVAAYAQAETLRRKDDQAERSAALGAYRRSAADARAAKDGCVLRIALIGSARVEAAAGSYRSARDHAQQALESTCADASAERAQAYKTLGLALGYLGEFEGAAQADQQALYLYRKVADTYYEGIVLGNLSAVYRELGTTGKALDAAHSALRLAETSHDSQGIVFNRESIAAIHLARGELAPALAAYRSTLVELRSTPYPMIEGQTWNDLGIVYRRLGEKQLELDAYQHAQAIWTRTDNRSETAETLLNQGEAQLGDADVASAQRSFAQALDIASADHLSSPQAHALRGLALCALADDRLDESATGLQSALVLARTIGEPALEASIEEGLGDLASRRLRQSDAQDHYQRALALARRAGDSAEQVVAWGNLARVAADANQLERAKTAIDHALVHIEDQRARIYDPELRTGYFASQRSYYDLGVDILMRMDAAHPRKGHAAAALALSERARAQALQDLLADRDIHIENKGTEPLLANERSAEDRLRQLAWQLARGSHNPTEHATLQADVDAASRTLDEIRGHIRASDPRYASFTRTRITDLLVVQQYWLDEHDVVLEYWLGAQRSYLWLLGKHDLQSFVLPPAASIEAAAQPLRDALIRRSGESAATLSIDRLAAIQRADEAAIRQHGRSVAEQVLAPVLPLLGARRAVVIGDGILQRLSFSALDAALLASGAAGTVRGFAYLPSLATLGWLRELPRPERPRVGIAVFADPVFRTDDPRLPATRVSVANTEVVHAATDANITAPPRLAHSSEEAHAIAALAPVGDTWLALGFDANRTAVLDADWSRYAIVHFATHALIDYRQPQLSGIVLSLYTRDGRPQDGFLRINDIYRLHLPADLVVLSTCDSAAGKAIGSEGPFSLSRAFFFAGTRRVVASLWPVDDRAADELMQRFHAALLREHESAIDALATAQQEMRALSRWNSPYYWGGFVLQGDWR